MFDKFPLKYIIQFDHNDKFLFGQTGLWWERLSTGLGISLFFCNHRIEKKRLNNYVIFFVINLLFSINQINIVTHLDFLGVLKLVAHSSWLHCQVCCNSAEIFFDRMAVIFHFIGYYLFLEPIHNAWANIWCRVKFIRECFCYKINIYASFTLSHFVTSVEIIQITSFIIEFIQFIWRIATATFYNTVIMERNVLHYQFLASEM